jgi:hypothetical protein
MSISDVTRTDLEQALKNIINDFDQTGCDVDVGTVSTASINEARRLFEMEPLQDTVHNT